MTDMFHTPRLFVLGNLAEKAALTLSEEQAHYLLHVLRLGIGAKIRLFNGREGEWQAAIGSINKRTAEVFVGKMIRAQKTEPDLWLVCAPIKKAHFDFTIEKATELGVKEIRPLLTARTQIREVNRDRCLSIAIEAAEQSERMNVPAIQKPATLAATIANWPNDRLAIVCAEGGDATAVHEAFMSSAVKNAKKAGIITGPEGGFGPEEFEALRELPNAAFIRLGPRILRADTAALAAIICWQAICGDWA